jgi:RHS repeat-associated protein
VVAQTDAHGTVTWTGSYEGYGTRTEETGTNLDRQRANTKEEDPTGLLNEGFRYRDLETGTWLSRDPAGFVDGPNLYAYVQQNPWTKFDPLGLHWQSFSSLPSTQSLGPDFARAERDAQRDGAAGIVGGAMKMVAKTANTFLTKVLRGGGGDATIAHMNGRIDAGIDRHMGDAFGADTGSLNYRVGSGGTEFGSAMVIAALVKSSSQKDTNTQTDPKIIKINGDKYPESAKHLEDAGAVDVPLTVDRAGRDARRKAALKEHDTVAGMDRDEAPPAVFLEGSQSVRPIPSSDNRGSGASMGNQIKDVKDGEKAVITIQRSSPPKEESK